MDTKTRVAMPAYSRPFLDTRLPDWVEPLWFEGKDQAIALAETADIGWFDMANKREVAQAIAAAGRLRWLNTSYVGLDGFPLDDFPARGIAVTNGAGLGATTIAEFVLMGMLSIDKSYRDIVRAQDSHTWLKDAPGKIELAGSAALIIGHGAIGTLVAKRLAAFEVAVTTVRRSADGRCENVIGPGDWRARLKEFDWVILTVPATAETLGMIGRDELAAMKTSAVLVNVSRGTLVDQAALVHALKNGVIRAAFLDVTTPEPLPPDHELWTLANAHITMHLSGKAQDYFPERASERFLQNLVRYHAGEPLRNLVDLARGY